MGRIRLLPDTLINQIAAGEVVERPASVVKELVENSLDAGASSVVVELQEGGRRRVAVEDDGWGMDREDALLAFQRHATSKLSEPEQLERIRTLGFRGEALPSLAAVSRCLVRSRTREGEAGVEIRLEGGIVREVREAGVPPGTFIEACDLFFNLPARRKFLRSVSTELSHSLAAVTRAALANPRVRFLLRHEGRSLLDLPAASGLDERLRQVYGEERLLGLLAVESRRGEGLRLTGLVSPVDGVPGRSGRPECLLFVNDRPVADRKLVQAVRAAYRSLSPAAPPASFILFLTLAPEEVDVNVHPAKSEVRFRSPGAVFEAVSGGVRQALLAGRAAAGTEAASARPDSPGPLGGAPPDDRPAGQSALGFSSPGGGAETAPGRFPYPLADGWPAPLAAREGPPPLPEPLAAGRLAGAWRVLGQWRSSYILAEDEEGLLLVDQHVAHERVLFEEYRRRAAAEEIPVQGLLVPHVFEVAPEQAPLLEEALDGLRGLGLELEHFGGSTFLFKGHPQFLGRLEAGPFLEEAVAILGGEGGSPGSLAVRLRERILISAACHAAVKVNTRLTGEGMNGLLEALWRTENPWHCPHGRPIVLRLSRLEVERRFGRR